jgi:hypothetical protein
MKSYLLILLFLGGVNSYSQVNENNNLVQGNMKAEELPEVVIKNAGKDFSIYLPDKNPDPKVRKLQENFIAYNLGKDYEGFDSFLVLLEIENGSLSATYNSNGKLTSVVENYKNVKLPSKVIYSIYKTYPGWEIINDKFLYTQENGNVSAKEYVLKIKKDKEQVKITVNPNGDILATK